MANNITCNVNPLIYVNSVNDSIVVQHVSVAQVRNVITSLKDSSPGWDHPSPFVMKQCVDTYVKPITVLINNSFYHGIFPDDNIQSETRSIKCGVPQVLILGPLLFIIYMNDICNVSELLYTIMYADDTSVIMSGNDLESLIQSVNSELCLLNTCSYISYS